MYENIPIHVMLFVLGLFPPFLSTNKKIVTYIYTTSSCFHLAISFQKLEKSTSEQTDFFPPSYLYKCEGLDINKG